MLRFSARKAGRLLPLAGAAAAALVIAAAGLANHSPGYDSIYQTANASWSCSDDGPTWQSGDLFCKTDNSTYTYFAESSLPASTRSMIYNMIETEYEPTDLSASLESPPSYSGGSETDVIFQYVSPFPLAGAAGLAWCDDAVSSTQCDQHYAIFDTTTSSYALACHETGHTVGLVHGPDSDPAQLDSEPNLGCMGTASGALTSHQRGEINGTY